MLKAKQMLLRNNISLKGGVCPATRHPSLNPNHPLARVSPFSNPLPLHVLEAASARAHAHTVIRSPVAGSLGTMGNLLALHQTGCLWLYPTGTRLSCSANLSRWLSSLSHLRLKRPAVTHSCISQKEEERHSKSQEEASWFLFSILKGFPQSPPQMRLLHTSH